VQAHVLESEGKFELAAAARDEAAYRRSPEALEQTAATAEQFMIFVDRLRNALDLPSDANPFPEMAKVVLRRHYQTYLSRSIDRMEESGIKGNAFGRHLTPEQVSVMVDRHIERFREKVLDGYSSMAIQHTRLQRARHIAERRANGTFAIAVAEPAQTDAPKVEAPAAADVPVVMQLDAPDDDLPATELAS
jgi:hypothetical protein